MKEFSNSEIATKGNASMRRVNEKLMKRVEVLHLQAHRYEEKGRASLAARDYLAALAEYRKTGRRDDLLAELLTETARVYFYRLRKNLKRSFELLQKVLALHKEKRAGREVIALDLHHIARVLEYLNDYPAAVRYYKKALDLLDSLKRPNMKMWLEVAQGMVWAYYVTGKNRQAYRFYLKLLPRIPRSSGRVREMVLFYLGSVTLRLQEAEQALNFYKEARRLCRLNRHPEPCTATLETGMAKAYEALKRRDEAERLRLTALKRSEKSHEFKLRWTWLGVMLRRKELTLYYMRGAEWEKAEALCKSTISIAKKLRYPYNPDFIRQGYQNLEFILNRLEKSAEAA